jgi:hypothetical protein
MHSIKPLERFDSVLMVGRCNYAAKNVWLLREKGVFPRPITNNFVLRHMIFKLMLLLCPSHIYLKCPPHLS